MKYRQWEPAEDAIIHEEIARGRVGWCTRAAQRIPSRTPISIQVHASQMGWTPRETRPMRVGSAHGVTKRAAHSVANHDEPDRRPSLRRPPPTTANIPDFLRDSPVWDLRDDRR